MNHSTRKGNLRTKNQSQPQQTTYLNTNHFNVGYMQHKSLVNDMLTNFYFTLKKLVQKQILEHKDIKKYLDKKTNLSKLLVESISTNDSLTDRKKTAIEKIRTIEKTLSKAMQKNPTLFSSQMPSFIEIENIVDDVIETTLDDEKFPEDMSVDYISRKLNAETNSTQRELRRCCMTLHNELTIDIRAMVTESMHDFKKYKHDIVSALLINPDEEITDQTYETIYSNVWPVIVFDA
jgi:hypothetical protein